MAVIERIDGLTGDQLYQNEWAAFAEENPLLLTEPVTDRDFKVHMADKLPPNVRLRTLAPCWPDSFRAVIGIRGLDYARQVLGDQAARLMGGDEVEWSAYDIQAGIALFQKKGWRQPTHSWAFPHTTEVIMDNAVRAEYMRSMLSDGTWLECWSPVSPKEEGWLRSWRGRLLDYPDTVAAIDRTLTQSQAQLPAVEVVDEQYLQRRAQLQQRLGWLISKLPEEL